MNLVPIVRVTGHSNAEVLSQDARYDHIHILHTSAALADGIIKQIPMAFESAKTTTSSARRKFQEWNRPARRSVLTWVQPERRLFG